MAAGLSRFRTEPWSMCPLLRGETMTLTNSNVSIGACVLFLFLMVIVSGCKRTPAVGGEEILPANFEVRVDVTHNSL